MGRATTLTISFMGLITSLSIISMKYNRKTAFTLIELIAVIAIIAILAGILLPTVSIAQHAMKRTQSKTLFAGWMNALQQYKQEYGYYPRNFFDSNGVFQLAGNNDAFIRALSGRDTGGAFTQSARNINRKGIRFYTFSDFDFNAKNQLADAFGNPNVSFVIDRNGDGIIEKSAEIFAENALTKVPVSGIRGSIVSYSLQGNSIDFKDVFSWN